MKLPDAPPSLAKRITKEHQRCHDTTVPHDSGFDFLHSDDVVERIDETLDKNGETFTIFSSFADMQKLVCVWLSPHHYQCIGEGRQALAILRCPRIVGDTCDCDE